MPPAAPMLASTATDVIVLGAGMVGVSAALHLQKRGRTVVLVDRRGAAEETSFGNAGLIQREGVVPYPFPNEPLKIAQYAFNMLPEANLHYSALPKIAPWLYRYWRASSVEGQARTSAGAKPLIENCVTEHEALMADAGISGMMRRTGYLRLYRSSEKFQAAIAKETIDREKYGVNFTVIDAQKITELEPHLTGPLAGGLLMPDPVSVADPGAVGKAYADLFVRRGGKFLRGEARSLTSVNGGWQILCADGPIVAKQVVIALGPWSGDVMQAQGYGVPLGIKRGYHMHYKAKGNATLNRPILDTDNGYVLSQMSHGLRLTTGAEFALRDAPPTPVQLGKVEPEAFKLFPLEARVDPQPWMGCRPCFPDMLPMIAEVPGRGGLWADFGHHHLGFTMGPVTGRLIAEMMTGETPFTDPKPYSADRFA
jgi:D-amino-acid dehydrogenase